MKLNRAVGVLTTIDTGDGEIGTEYREARADDSDARSTMMTNTETQGEKVVRRR